MPASGRSPPWDCCHKQGMSRALHACIAFFGKAFQYMLLGMTEYMSCIGFGDACVMLRWTSMQDMTMSSSTTIKSCKQPSTESGSTRWATDCPGLMHDPFLHGNFPKSRRPLNAGQCMNSIYSPWRSWACTVLVDWCCCLDQICY